MQENIFKHRQRIIRRRQHTNQKQNSYQSNANNGYKKRRKMGTYKTDIALNWEPQKTKTRKYIRVWVQPTHFPWLSELALGQKNGNTRPRTNNQSVFLFFFLPPAKSPGSDSNQNGRAAAHNATRATVHWEDRQDPWHIHSYVQHRGFKYSSRGAGFRNCLHKHREKKKKNVRPTG